MSARSTASSNSAAFTHRQIVVVLVGLMLSVFLAALDLTILGTALPTIARDLGGQSEISWIISIYMLTSTASTPIFGKLSDLHGRRRLMQAAILLFLVGSTLCALAGSMTGLIAARALQGMGGGGILVVSAAAISDIISPRERGKYQGYMAGMWMLAGMAGPVLGGFFVDHLSWRWVFWINLPLGIIALGVCEHSLRRLKVSVSPHRIDYLGAVLIFMLACAILLATTLIGNPTRWSPWLVPILLTAAVVLFALTWAQEARVDEPVLPPRLLAVRNVAVGNFGSMLQSMGLLAPIIFTPVYLQLIYGLTPEQSGWAMMPVMVTTPAAVVICGFLIARSGRYRAYPLGGFALGAIALPGLALLPTAAPLWMPLALLVAVSIGAGLVGPTLMVSLQNSLAADEIGSGTAAFSLFRSLGSAFGATLLGTILVGRGGAGQDFAALIAPGSFQVMFAVAGAICVLGAFVCAFTEDIPLRTSVDREAGILESASEALHL